MGDIDNEARLTESQKAMDKAKIQLMMKPNTVFFTSITFSLSHKWDWKIPTACTNGLEIRYNPDFFMGLDKEEQLFLILHETLHVAFQHMMRLNDRDPRKWNIAADYVINLILVKQGYKMPKGGLLDYQYDEMTSEQVYDLLPDNPEEGDLPMVDLESPPGESEEEQQAVSEKIDDILVKAKLQAEMSGQSAGSIPGELAFYIESLLTPKLPWHSLLRQFMTKVIRQGYTWRRPNRRFWPKHYLPSRLSKNTCHIAVAIDTSCSVSDEEFHRFASETHSILTSLRPAGMTLIQFDTEIKSVTEIDSPDSLRKQEFKGRGGTRIKPVMEWAAQNKPTVLLIFTDGYFSQDFSNPKVPLLWLINDNDGFDTRWGRVIHYDT